jgi:hypothetical protein
MGRCILKNKEEEGMAEIIPGGFAVHKEVGEDEMALFNVAMKHHYGINLKPVAVASQIVNGYNYIYICVGTPVVANPVSALYAVKIYAHFAHSVAPTIEVTGIEEIDISKLI